MNRLPSELATARGITELLHFTTDKGILGSLRKGALLSRDRVQDDPELAFIFLAVWPVRLPEWIDYISLSITRINVTLHDRAVANLTGRWWGILSFDPAILDDDDVWFATTNNAYDDVCQRARGAIGLDALFGPRIPWGYRGSVSRRSAATPNNLTTNSQAEVLYPGEIPLDYLQRIYVREDKNRWNIRALCSAFDIEPPEIVVAPEKFG